MTCDIHVAQRGILRGRIIVRASLPKMRHLFLSVLFRRRHQLLVRPRALADGDDFRRHVSLSLSLFSFPVGEGATVYICEPRAKKKRGWGDLLL